MVSLDDCGVDVRDRGDDVVKRTGTVDRNLGANWVCGNSDVHDCADRVDPRAVQARAAAAVETGKGVARGVDDFGGGLCGAGNGVLEGEVLLVRPVCLSQKRDRMHDADG